jgi:hypothetical protein
MGGASVTLSSQKNSRRGASCPNDVKWQNNSEMISRFFIDLEVVEEIAKLRHWREEFEVGS